MNLLINWVCVLDMKVQGNCIYMILIENRYESSPVKETVEEVWTVPLLRSLVTC